MESVSGCLQIILNAIGVAHPVMFLPPGEAALRPRGEGLAFLERHVAGYRDFDRSRSTSRIQIAECHFSTLQMMQEIN